MFSNSYVPRLRFNEELFDQLAQGSEDIKALSKQTQEDAYEVVNVLRDEIRDTTRKFQELAKIVQDGLIVTSEDNTITDYSPAAERIFGWKKEEVLGKDMSILVPDNYYRIFLHILNENPDEMISMTNGRAKSKQGENLDIEFTVSRLSFVGEQFNFIVVRNVTDQLRRIREIKEKNKILTAIATCSKLWYQKDWRANIEIGLAHLGEAVGADAVSVFEYIHQECQLQHEWQKKPDSVSLTNIDCKSPIITKILKKLVSGDTVLITGATQDESELLKNLKHKSLTLVPIHANQKFWGFFAYHFKNNPKAWFDTVLESLSTLTDILGSALEHKGQQKEIQVLQNTLNSLSDSLLITDSEGVVIFSNKAFCDIFNMDHREIIGKNLWKENTSIPEGFWETICHGDTWEGEMEVKLGRKKMTARSVVIPILNGEPTKPSYFLAIKKPN